MNKRFGISFIVISIVVAWVLVALFFTDSNWPKINRSDLVGNWISNYEQANYRYSDQGHPEYQGGIHRLELKEDGTYVYEYTSFDGKEKYRSSDSWVFDPSHINGVPYIVLSNFVFGSTKFQTKFQGKVGSTGLPVTRWFGKIRITIRDDYGYYFRKEK